MPRSVAAIIIAIVAWPTSYWSVTFRRSSGGSGKTNAIAAAAPAMCPAPCQTVDSSSSWVRSVTMTKSHAWRFFADGARHPASAIRFRSSSDTGSDVYCRTLRRARTASQVSISSFRLRLWSGLFEGLERQRDRDLVAHHGATAIEGQLGAYSEVLAA